MAEILGAATDRWQIVFVVVERDGSLLLVAEPTRSAVPCPRCGELSRRRHSRYERRPLDLPWRGRAVRLKVHTRRWFCDAPSCSRKVFAERFDGALATSARRTDGATELLKAFALQAGGEGGARLAQKAGVPTSPDTLLRLLHTMLDVPTRAPRVLGVDDVALRRGRGVRRYGTLLVDLETHRPIDLLDDRTAEVFANWLRNHPGVEVIVRDRAGAYAEGARQGAPEAVQVADRFHLSANASAALDEVLRSRRRRIEYVVVEPEPEVETGITPALPPPPMSRAKKRELEARSRRVARWQTVRERHASGEPIRRIALDLAMSRMTVRRLIRTPEAPRNHHSSAIEPVGSPRRHLCHTGRIWRLAGKRAVPTSLSSFENSKRSAIAGVGRSCTASSSPGVDHGRRPTLATAVERIDGSPDRAELMSGGCAYDHPINWRSTNAKHSRMCSPMMNA